MDSTFWQEDALRQLLKGPLDLLGLWLARGHAAELHGPMDRIGLHRGDDLPLQVVQGLTDIGHLLHTRLELGCLLLQRLGFRKNMKSMQSLHLSQLKTLV